MLGIGLVLRVLTWIAYRPSILYIDSFRYLDNLTALSPVQLNPIGYDLVLNVFVWIGGTALVAAVQHLAGLAIALGIYALALRLGAYRWVAALASAALLLDAYQLQIEQNIMSEIWFQGVLIGLLWLLAGRRGQLARGSGPSWRAAAAVGVLIGFGVLLRLIGIVLVVPVLGYLILAGGAIPARQWRLIGTRVLGVAVGLAVVLVPYVTYFHSATGRWGLTISSGNVLYGRAATVADCRTLDLKPELRVFCPKEPLDERLGVDWYTHADTDPNWPGPLPPGSDRLALAGQFGKQVLFQQPFDVLGKILIDIGKSFSPIRKTFDKDVAIERWQFQYDYPTYGAEYPTPDDYTERYDGMRPTVQPQLAWFLRAYQFHGGYTPGPALAIAGLLGVAGVFRRSGRLRSAALLATGSAVLLLVGTDAFEFSWRYQLPGLVLFPVAGAIGLTALLRGRRSSNRQSSTTGSDSTP